MLLGFDFSVRAFNFYLTIRMNYCEIWKWKFWAAIKWCTTLRLAIFYFCNMKTCKHADAKKGGAKNAMCTFCDKSFSGCSTSRAAAHILGHPVFTVKQNPFQSYKASSIKQLSEELFDQAYKLTAQLVAPILAIAKSLGQQYLLIRSLIMEQCIV